MVATNISIVVQADTTKLDKAIKMLCNDSAKVGKLLGDIKAMSQDLTVNDDIRLIEIFSARDC